MHKKMKIIIILVINLITLLMIFYAYNDDIVRWAIVNNKYHFIRSYALCGYNFNRIIAEGEISKSTGATPLFYANTSKMCLILIEEGADINRRCFYGTPLMKAIKDKNYEVMDVLLRNVADINLAKNNDPYFDSIYMASVQKNDPLALYYVLRYSKGISMHKLILYLRDINNRTFAF